MAQKRKNLFVKTVLVMPCLAQPFKSNEKQLRKQQSLSLKCCYLQWAVNCKHLGKTNTLTLERRTTQSMKTKLNCFTKMKILKYVLNLRCMLF